MEAIHIPQLLKAPEKTEEIQLQESFAELKTLMPVRGLLRVTHQGTYLEVTAKAETIVTLSCDRCLQQYNHRLSLDTKELIWLEEIPLNSLPLEREVALEELTETLDPQGYFEVDTWLYEQLCLALPWKKVCSSDCQTTPLNSTKDALIDSRWSSLEILKKQLITDN
ncbi:MAG: YceD family protein [Spirulinaceae cyanobacterium]